MKGQKQASQVKRGQKIEPSPVNPTVGREDNQNLATETMLGRDGTSVKGQNCLDADEPLHRRSETWQDMQVQAGVGRMEGEEGDTREA